MTIRSRLVMAVALVLAMATTAASADLTAGINALERGDHVTALRELTPLAERGNAQAQNGLGYMYSKGLGVPQDRAAALIWYRAAAGQGLATAQMNLGKMYADGDGIPQDYAEALTWYRRAAEQGHAGAQGQLGFMYAEGQGVPQDHAEALQWFRKGAEQGDPKAQFNLGTMYDRGRGVPQDGQEALKWLTRAAEQGHTGAQSNLGAMFFTGQGVSRDYAEALRWTRKAAEGGEAAAQYNLAIMYDNGLGVPQDSAEALEWLQRAADQGYEDAKTAMGKVDVSRIERPADDLDRLLAEADRVLGGLDCANFKNVPESEWQFFLENYLQNRNSLGDDSYTPPRQSYISNAITVGRQLYLKFLTSDSPRGGESMLIMCNMAQKHYLDIVYKDPTSRDTEEYKTQYSQFAREQRIIARHFGDSAIRQSWENLRAAVREHPDLPAVESYPMGGSPGSTTPSPPATPDRISAERVGGKVRFSGLPSRCEVTVYSLAGDRCARMVHESVEEAGALEWDMIGTDGKTVPAGIYIFSVQANGRSVKTGRFVTSTVSDQQTAETPPANAAALPDPPLAFIGIKKGDTEAQVVAIYGQPRTVARGSYGKLMFYNTDVVFCVTRDDGAVTDVSLYPKGVATIRAKKTEDQISTWVLKSRREIVERWGTPNGDRGTLVSYWKTRYGTVWFWFGASGDDSPCTHMEVKWN